MYIKKIYIILTLIVSSPIFVFSQVIAEGDTVLCDGQQGNVEVTLTATSYAVDLIDSGIYSDDTHGGVIDMGFDFVFYGNTYNQVVLASNNYLTFNTANANQYSDWTIGEAVPSPNDPPMNAILCPWQDIYPGSNGNGIIAYATTGEEPNRVFIASFCGIPMFSCTDICYSSQIKLYETTNVIETHIAQKVLCDTWNGGAAIHALHNIDGTIAHVVTGDDGVERNYPNQWTCENDAWQFTPNGDADYVLESIEFAPAVAGTDITWQDQFGNFVGLGGSITVFPAGDVTYTAGASLCGDAGDWCGFEGGIEGDDVSIVFDSVNITGYDITNASCDIGSSDGGIVVYLDGNESLDYLWQSSSGEIISTTGNQISDVVSDVYQFTVTTDNGCEDTIELFVDIDGVPVSNSEAGQDIQTCELQCDLNASAPLDGESGYWTLISGQGDIVQAISPSTSVLNLGVGSNIFEWTLTNECGTNVDQVEVDVLNSNPIIDIADGSCLEQIELFVSIDAGDGQWSVIPNEGVFIDNVSSLNTFASFTDYGEYFFSFEGCNGSDTQTVLMQSVDPVITGPSEVFCLESFQLDVVVEGDYDGLWSVLGPGNALFDDESSTNPIIEVDNYGEYEFTYSGCGANSSFIVDVQSVDPVITGPSEVFCLESFQLDVLVEGDLGLWEVYGPGEVLIDNISSVSPIIDVDVYGTYEFVYSGCGSSSSFSIELLSPNPYIEEPDIIFCSLETTLIAYSDYEGSWSTELNNVTIIDNADNTAYVQVSEYGQYEIEYTSCGITDAVIVDFQTIEPVILASDHENCMYNINLSVMNTGSPILWEQIEGPSTADIINPNSFSTTVQVSEFGLYSFSLTTCDNYSTVNVGVSCPLNIPNSFSPNSDGLNDVFIIPYLTADVYTESVFYVFNKWGMVVYINPEYGISGEWWDGTTTYSDKQSSSLHLGEASGHVTNGIYFYTLEVYNYARGQKEFYSGDISVFSNDD